MRLSFLFLFIPLALSCGNKFPEKMPADFKIEYHLDGGKTNTNQTIIIQTGECSDKGRAENGEEYDLGFVITDTKEFEVLYNDLKKINVFSIKSTDKGEVMDRGGESIRFTINGKVYDVNNSQSNFISKEDVPAFDNAISMIKKFSELRRFGQLTVASENKDSSMVNNNSVDSISTESEDNEKGGEVKTDKLAGTNESNLSDKNNGIPPKMPNDFKIEYNMSGGISGAYRKIVLQYGSSTEEGKKAGEAKYSNSFMNMALKDYESLYNDLYKLNAFLLKYTSNNKTADRGGEMLTFTINNKKYTVSDKDNDYIKASDKAAFKKSTGLVLEYVDSHKK